MVKTKSCQVFWSTKRAKCGVKYNREGEGAITIVVCHLCTSNKILDAEALQSLVHVAWSFIAGMRLHKAVHAVDIPVDQWQSTHHRTRTRNPWSIANVLTIVTIIWPMINTVLKRTIAALVGESLHILCTHLSSVAGYQIVSCKVCYHLSLLLNADSAHMGEKCDHALSLYLDGAGNQGCSMAVLVWCKNSKVILLE